MTNRSTDKVLDFVIENDVKFIRLAFCDLFGRQKNVSVYPNELRRAITHGIPIDASMIEGFANTGNNDLFLMPEISTFCVLPWRPQQGRVARFYCDILTGSGKPFSLDTRAFLKRAAKRTGDMGYDCNVSAECEFYLFKTDEDGEPSYVPYDRGNYLDISPLDKGENIRREICLTLDEMGVSPEMSHHEEGPGQNEIVCKYTQPLEAADNFFTFKTTAKAIAARSGLFASFMPKPLAGKSGNGLHINLSLCREGKNMFDHEGSGPSPEAMSFLAGVLERAGEITAFTNPTVNSYKRLGAMNAPRSLNWGYGGRSLLIRIPAEGGELARMELRSPDPSANSYLVIGLILHAGLDGIERGLKPPLPAGGNGGGNAGFPTLPSDLGKALDAALHSDFIGKVLGEEALMTYVSSKRDEIGAYEASENKAQFETERYFYRL